VKFEEKLTQGSEDVQLLRRYTTGMEVECGTPILAQSLVIRSGQHPRGPIGGILQASLPQ